MAGTSKICSLSDAIRSISDGDSIAIGGAHGHGHPMAAVREIIRQKRRGLRVSGYSTSVAIDLLSAAGCASVVEPNAGPRLWAAALGLRMLPLSDGVDAGQFPPEGCARRFVDPFTGETALAVQALTPSCAIIHARSADAAGNAEINPGVDREGESDLMIARAARRVIVTTEQIVSEAAVAIGHGRAVLSGELVTCVVEAPFGTHPCDFDGRYTGDLLNLERCRVAATDPGAFAPWRSEYVDGVADHWAYVDRIGSRALMGISLMRACRA
jgi:glutaconate CoA-transferase, subunit A